MDEQCIINRRRKATKSRWKERGGSTIIRHNIGKSDKLIYLVSAKILARVIFLLPLSLRVQIHRYPRSQDGNAIKSKTEIGLMKGIRREAGLVVDLL